MFDLNEQNAKLRVMKFFRDLNVIIKENSWENSVNADPSEVFPIVIYQIQPATLRMRLQSDILYNKTVTLSDMKALAKHIALKADEYEPYRLANSTFLSMKGFCAVCPDQRSTDKGQKTKPSQQQDKKKSEKSIQPSSSKQISTPSARTRISEPLCLVDTCRAAGL